MSSSYIGSGRPGRAARPDLRAVSLDASVGAGSAVDSWVQPISMYLSAIFHAPSTLRTVS